MPSCPFLTGSASLTSVLRMFLHFCCCLLQYSTANDDTVIEMTKDILTKRMKIVASIFVYLCLEKGKRFRWMGGQRRRANFVSGNENTWKRCVGRRGCRNDLFGNWNGVASTSDDVWPPSAIRPTTSANAEIPSLRNVIFSYAEIAAGTVLPSKDSTALVSPTKVSVKPRFFHYSII